jgi:hemolysin activation/secretion protein
MLRRRGRPGLLGTVARTAVIAGTATATANAVDRHGEQKAAEKQANADQQAAQQQAAQQQAAPPPPPPPAPAPPAAADDDLVGQIGQLGKLRDTGVLSDSEFAAAKAKLLGI